LAYIPPPSNLPPGSLVDTYIRDSGGPRQEASTDQQLAEIEAFCAAHGLQLRRRFIDVARSGGSTVGRDEFNRMVDSTRRPEDRPLGLLLWNYARFARDLDDAIYYKALLRNRNIIVHSLTDPIPEGQYGRIIEFFIDISNEEKRRQTSTDVKRGLRDLVTSHGCVPGVPPLGFVRQPVHIGTRRDGTPRIGHRWVPDPAFLPRIRRAFSMRASGFTLSQIQAELHLFAGINSYKSFYSNQLYIGILEFADLVIENYCEPIIDMATWNAVQQRIQDHNRARYDRNHPRRANTPYLLSGLVYCGSCGSPMGSHTATGSQKGRNEAYRCGRSRRRAGCTQGRIGRHTLETAVITTLRDHILQPDALAAMLEIDRKAVDHREARRIQRLETLRDERKKLSGQIVNVTRAIAERGGSQALLDKLNELENQRARAITEISELENQRTIPAPDLTQAELVALSTDIIAALDSADPQRITKIMRAIIHKVVVKKDDDLVTGTITYYAPTPDHDPPFDLPPSAGKGDMLMEVSSLGAHIWSMWNIISTCSFCLISYSVCLQPDCQVLVSFRVTPAAGYSGGRSPRAHKAFHVQATR
jgi:DNA invertase Pin-like site-specific DNA recombinase